MAKRNEFGEPVELVVDGHPVEITSPEKVLFPKPGLTKLDLAKYYVAVGPALMRWIRDRPVLLERFPNGVFIVFANNYEFTDGTGDVQACDVSGLAGFDQPVPYPDQLASLVVWVNEQYLSIAVENGADMIFLMEDFCGHGFNADDPTAPCYRGPGNENWFDLTCIHPNPTGHDHIKDMFMAVVNE